MRSIIDNIPNFSLEARFEKLSGFLKLHIPKWNEEILFRYPEILQEYPLDWIKQMQELSLEDLHQFEMSLDPKYVKSPEFKSFLTTITELCEFPAMNEYSALDLPKYIFMNIKHKKLHEITQIVSFFQENPGRRQFIDLCAGKGLLSQCLQLKTQRDVTSVDFDEVLQEYGKKRWRKFSLEKGNLNYVQADLFKDNCIKPQEDSFIVGLHTCGALSLKQFALSLKNSTQGGLNFGCCYHRLTPGAVFQSEFAKKFGFTLHQAALTLASRGQFETLDEYKFTVAVKTYRYMFHLFLYYHFDIREFKKLGNSPKRLYKQSFAEYAKVQLSRLELSTDQKTLAAAAEFWQNEKMQEKMNELYYGNRLRAFLARPLESLLLLDRALYLQEQGYTVRLNRWFDHKLSPRNLGILYCS